MKKLTFVFVAAILFVACQNSAKKATTDDTESKVAESTEITQTVFTVDEIQEKGYDFVGKEVVVSGTVSHVCRHSGKRCFLMGSNEDITIKVEAGKKIGSFSQDQMGSDLKITGTLQEIRIDDNYIAELEEEAKSESAVQEEESGDHCSDELKHITELREKIEKSGRGYYSIFYMDGEKYDVIN